MTTCPTLDALCICGHRGRFHAETPSGAAPCSWKADDGAPCSCVNFVLDDSPTLSIDGAKNVLPCGTCGGYFFIADPADPPKPPWECMSCHQERTGCTLRVVGNTIVSRGRRAVSGLLGAERLGDRPVIASVSGGKDSAAMSLALTEAGIEHERIYLDTGWEHADTYDYIRGELTRVIGPIRELRGKYTMETLIAAKAMFPRRTIRFCTEELKVFPCRDYIATRQESGPVVNAIGLRRAESKARASLEPWEWSEAMDCDVWRPLLDWTMEDVVAIHKRHGLRPNPLYLRGATRVGCWPCIHANKEELRIIAEASPERIATIREMEGRLTVEADARYEKRGDVSPGPRTFFQGRGTIDEAVAWSKTTRGGRQLALYHPESDGCMRWGMCEVEEREAAP